MVLYKYRHIVQNCLESDGTGFYLCTSVSLVSIIPPMLHIQSHTHTTYSKSKVKVALWDFSTLRPFGLLYSYPQQVPASISRDATHHTDARDLYQRRRELLPMNFASKSVIHERTRFFYMPQSWDMGHILLLPLRRKAFRGFSGRSKNPMASAGFEPANSGSSGQYTKH